MIKKATKGNRVFYWGMIVLSLIALSSINMSTATAAETKPIQLRLAHIIPPAYSGAETEQFFADEVNKRTKGKVNVKIYWSEGLGKTKEVLGLVRNGTVDIACFPAGYFSSQFPIWQAPNSIPFIMTNAEQAQQIGIRAPIEVPAVAEEIKKQNIKNLYHHIMANYQLFSTRPVVKFEDFKGLKVRTWGNQLPRAYQAAGAVAVTMFTPETYEALKRRTIDATMWPLVVGYSVKHHEVAPHICLWNMMTIVAWGAWMNIDVWNKLPGDVQNTINDVIKDTLAFEKNRAITKQIEARKKMEKEGKVTFHDVPASEREKWVKASPDFVEEWVQEMDKQGKGDGARQLRDLWLKIVKENEGKK